MAAKNVSIGQVSSSCSSSSCSSSLKPLSFPEVERDLRCYYDANYDVPIPCMLCETTFDVNTEHSKEAAAKLEDHGDLSRQLFIQHLFKEHKMVIHRISDIANYQYYSRYWKIRFKEVDIDQLLPIIKTNPQTSDPSETFYLLSDANQEDKELRKFLQQKKLVALLRVQQRERDSTDLCRPCLFCSETFTGNRSLLFRHMNKSHNFSIGQPDNIVFVDEFLDALRTKLTNLQCLYCERTFRDLSTLKDHMRKKQHRKINSSNKIYDKYYLINHLEIGKSWQEIQKEDDKDIGVDDESEGENITEEEDVTSDSSIVCLFCTIALNSVDKIIHHMMETHGFDYSNIMSSLKDDFYGQVKVINYIRRQIHHKICIYCEVKHNELSKLIDHMTVTRHFQLPQRSLWDQPQYLFPTYENDRLLCVLDADSNV